MTNITLRIDSVNYVITIKDFKFGWVKEYWEEERTLSGAYRKNIRGFSPVLELNFEDDTQLKTVINIIGSAILNEKTIQYVGDDGVLNVLPEKAEYIEDYVNQIKRQPNSLVLSGNIQDKIGFFVTGILCGDEVVTCGREDVLCGG